MTPDTRKDEKGAVLITVLLFMAVITAIGVALIAEVTAEGKDIERDHDKVRALFSADAACIDVVARLADPNNVSYIGPSISNWSAKPGWGVFVRQVGDTSALDSNVPNYTAPNHDHLDNDNDGTVDETGENYSVHSVAPTDGISYSWARATLRLDSANKILRYGDSDNDERTAPTANLSVGEPIVIVTGQSRVGASTRTIEMELVKLEAGDRYVIKSRREL